ncbi:MAG: preprotein translocase subunit SecY [Candidatus Aenigmatarchaeota archaeon]|nr:MAG: preprotein translocase subunit SecY [Candidatus Aenigmarchaeota archaeon]
MAAYTTAQNANEGPVNVPPQTVQPSAQSPVTLSLRDVYVKFINWLPGLDKPREKLLFKTKLIWTAAMLLSFYVMSEIRVWGSGDPAGNLALAETVLGSQIGTLMTLGIGPIVTASIILQLISGSGMIRIDTSTHQGRAVYQGTQKVLAIGFAFFEAIAFVMFGAVPPASAGLGLAAAVMFQIALGGLIVILMDEVVSKWGIGSGISLFIAAGVGREIFIRAFNFVGQGGVIRPVGNIPVAVSSFMSGAPGNAFIALVPIAITIVVFFIVVYAQAMKVEIPMTINALFGKRVAPGWRGLSHRYPLKLLYTSNIPVILMSALLANFQLWATLLQSRGSPILGTVGASGIAETGLISWISPPTQVPFSEIMIAALDPSVSVNPDAWRWITYAIFLTAGSIIFAFFWVNTAGLDSKTMAQKMHNAGFGVPGFRSDVRVVERVLDRYIPALTILSGAFIGLLASFADFAGVLGSGTGILLAVMIIYNLYEQIAQQHVEEMHPIMRKFMGGT